MKVLSLFANIGVAEAYLGEIGFDVKIANELIERRANLYKEIYPDTNMICGDITDENVKNAIISASKEIGVSVIMATPPCQGMSTAGQQNIDDPRNLLITDVVSIVLAINPKYVFIENVPLFYSTSIYHKGKRVEILQYLSNCLDRKYKINSYVIDTSDYGIPQTRERAVMLLSRNDCPVWELPEKEQITVSMEDAIGHLPMLDPFVKDINREEFQALFPKYKEREEEAKKISFWHRPPHHIKRQVVAMQHTPTGKTAFDNEHYYPIKDNGERVKGYRNTYKRQNWDTPAYTVTMDNRKISSQNNVHPGHLEYINDNGEAIYSDARVLTLYELMKIMSLPDNWPVPHKTSEAFLRSIIGEGIPPLFVKKVFQKLLESCNE